MTPPASAARGAHTPGARARVALVIAAMLTMLVAPLSGAVGSVTAAAAATPPVGLSFRAAVDANGVATDEGQLRVVLSVVNETAATVGSTTADLAVSREPLASRTAVEAWLSGSSSPALRAVGSETLSTVPSLSSTTTTATVETGDDLKPGVYALRATYGSSQGTLISRAVWVVSDDDEGDIAVVVPITSGPRTEGLLSSDELALLTAPGGSLRVQLDAVTGTSAILAVDPAIVASIRVLGTTAPDVATEWLDDLMTLGNSRFALQFGDADLAVQYNAGLAEPLAVPALESSLVAAGFEPATPDPSATPGAEQPIGPDLETLTDIGATVDDVFWPAGGTAGPDVVAELGDAGDGSSLTLVPSATVGGDEGHRARDGDAQLLVYDSDVSTALHTASTAHLRVERTAALATASAYASFTAADTTLLVTVDRADDRTPLALRGAVRAAVRLDDRATVGLSELAAFGPSAEVTVADIEPDAARITALEDFLTDEGVLARFATILEDPTVLTAPERAAVLQLLGNAWLADPAAWTDAVAAHRAATTARLDSVSIVPSPDINLFGSSAPLTFSVRNDLPWPVSLVLVTEPNDPRLVVQEITEFTAGALQTTRVDVPVQARVGSGDSSLDLHLRSTSMVDIGGTTTIAVKVQAEWETVGIVVMAVLVGGLLVLGIIRTVLRIRRRTAPASDGRSDG